MSVISIDEPNGVAATFEYVGEPPQQAQFA